MVSACLANERCQRPTERAKETSSKKMTEKQQQQSNAFLSWIEKEKDKKKSSTSRYNYRLNAFSP